MAVGAVDQVGCYGEGVEGFHFNWFAEGVLTLVVMRQVGGARDFARRSCGSYVVQLT